MNKVTVAAAQWQKNNADIRRIRESVFIVEQSVPAELEWDAEDADAVHFLAYEGDYAIGTARLLNGGEIGRLSVLKDWRGLRVGEMLLEAVLLEAEKRGFTTLRLSAQVQAVEFYQRYGFQITSKEFLEAGLPHVDMLRQEA
ncbi:MULTISPECIES: GNAT family N-acetyltransferase [Pseudomonas syringae group]|uniref:GCN5-related N-acetyltransferase n=3 Tax=Pseudomonas syringae group TaxID=136849 RepID=A0AA40P779_9PSED|nr:MULTISPECIES: GNAT family N-acetyltransferase [Pseudomonas syringae group]KGS13908.1 GNAT family acetyltransferase [Pseudomonas coronafaciens]KPB50036.1 GCN5-related N-acetyltransferase [Pseudomonas coronafaciens pv. oryzae]KPW31265.1 GCN5-related N-acetyltransferase [Pseudomonas coronafaciens pv. atropurpurea]KPX29073.1 GCN5-related N-acetyltransferase [Pseudomonas coronafaciens pv. garcae]KPY03069.1 GCN5-related N-acetyltransferase [Pseudomonas coronafaciens pv. oryzae]